MLKVYYRILISSWENFGFGFIFWRWLLIAPLFFLFTHFTLFLDRIFFPQYRQVQVNNPVFIIGNPRSGTSFLHRLLTKTQEFSAFEAWHLFFPSITARVLLKPLITYLIKNNRGTILSSQDGHELSLDKVEHDEFLFMHKLDTQFVFVLSPIAFDDREYPEIRFHDQQPESRRQSSVRFFKACLQRQIYYTGKQQVISHGHYSTHRIKTLMESFPDAKFIYLARTPYETIPSHLSIDSNAIDHSMGIKNIPTSKLKQYFQRRYCYDIELYRYFYDLHKNQVISEDRVMILRYDELCSSLQNAFEKIVAFTGIKPSDQLRQAVERQAQIQKGYKRKHKVMSLEEFDLTKEQIANDLSFVFEEYGYDKNPVPKPAV